MRGQEDVRTPLAAESEHRDRLVVAYVGALLAKQGAGALSKDEGDGVLVASADLRTALAAVIALRGEATAFLERAPQLTHAGPTGQPRGFAHWLVVVGGIVTFLLVIPATAR